MTGVLIGSAITLIGVLLNSYFTRKTLKLQLQHQKEENAYNLKRQNLSQLYKFSTIYISNIAHFTAELAHLKKESFTFRDYKSAMQLLMDPLSDITSLVKIDLPELDVELKTLIDSIPNSIVYSEDYLGSKITLDDLNRSLNSTRTACRKLNSSIEKLALEHEATHQKQIS